MITVLYYFVFALSAMVSARLILRLFINNSDSIFYINEDEIDDEDLD